MAKTNSGFERFDNAVRKVLNVSHEELLRREQEWRRKRARKRRVKASLRKLAGPNPFHETDDSDDCANNSGKPRHEEHYHPNPAAFTFVSAFFCARSN